MNNTEKGTIMMSNAAIDATLPAAVDHKVCRCNAGRVERGAGCDHQAGIQGGAVGVGPRGLICDRWDGLINPGIP